MVVSCGVVHRGSLDPMLLWLWCRPATVALIQPLAWELPCATGAALKKKKKKKKKREKKKRKRRVIHSYSFTSAYET